MENTIMCPHCKRDFRFQFCVKVPDESTLTMRIEAKEGCPFSARTLGKAIVSMGAALEETARSLGGQVATFVTRMQIEGDVAEVTFAVLSKTPQGD